jgi:hypothetical protein
MLFVEHMNASVMDEFNMDYNWTILLLDEWKIMLNENGRWKYWK